MTDLTPSPKAVMARVALQLVAAIVLSACNSSLDWRQMQPEGLGLSAAFPCRPASHARQVKVAGLSTEMTLYACTAQDTTFAVGSLDAGEPARVGDVLVALRAAALANVRGQVRTEGPANVPGMTPHPSALETSFDGSLPDGRPVQESLVVFSRGTRVYQATLVGGKLSAEVVRTFLDALKVNA